MKRICLILLCCILGCHLTRGQIYVNGSKAEYDKLTGSFLAIIPKEQWGKDCLCSITLSDSAHWENVMVNGQPIDTPVLFEKILPTKAYDLTASLGDSTVNAHLEFTYLPIIHLYGEFGYDNSPGKILLQQPGAEAEEMDAIIRWRGASTNQPFKHKRNYRIKLVNDKGEKMNKRLFSLREDDDWILDAGQADMFRLRNHIAAELWDDFATQPYYANGDNKVHTASRGEVVEVFLNDEYIGIYNFCEPIDRKQLNVKKFDSDTGEIHGGLWKAVGWSVATFSDPPPPYDNTLPQWSNFELKYPEIDDLCPSDYSTLYNAIDFVAHAQKKDFKEYIAGFIDLPVFYDYILFMNVLDAFDIAGKNLYWAVYDKQEDKKITLAVWDLDDTMGQCFSADPPPHPDYVSYDSWPMLPTQIGLLLYRSNYNNFRQEIGNRYFQLRKDVFSFDNLIGRYQAHYDLINGCGAVQREERRWSGDSDIAGLTLDFASELAYIYNWLEHRLEHLDVFFKDPVGIHNIFACPTDDREFTPFGTPVTPFYRGVVISQGKKYLKH